MGETSIKQKRAIPPFHQLSVEGIEVQSHIGCSEDERADPQELRLDVYIRFPAFPKAAVSDSLSETVCYTEITRIIVDYFQNHQMQLIETAAYECYSRLKTLDPDTQWCIRLNKVRPPVPAIKSGTQFICGDFQI